MKKEICSTLAEIEKLHNVKILYACESGSRAWGFPSPDSDYDARYLYIRPLESYLKLFPEFDSYFWAKARPALSLSPKIFTVNVA